MTTAPVLLLALTLTWCSGYWIGRAFERAAWVAEWHARQRAMTGAALDVVAAEMRRRGWPLRAVPTADGGGVRAEVVH